MSSSTKLDLVKKFIFNDNVQHILSNINDNLMDFNILEITGMGNQEIKHSNILGWLFDDSEHNLEYLILFEFLKKIIEQAKQNDENEEIVNDLQSYIYLSQKKKNITIYREKDNIDLLIVDESNKIVITIENKVYASERVDGNDGGQLQKYKDIIDSKYNETYKKYFVFLTIDLEEPTRERWLKASHQMITNVIENILKTKELTTKTSIVLESYVDLLKRNGIVEDEKLKELCEQIWDNADYKNALEIIHNYKPDILDKISTYIQNKLSNYNDIITLDDSTRSYIRFFDKSWNSEKQKKGEGWTSSKNVLLYEFKNRKEGLLLTLIIGPSNNSNFREEIYNEIINSKVFTSTNRKLANKFSQIWTNEFISKDDINNKSIEEITMTIDTQLDKFFKSDFKTIQKVLETVMNN